MFLNRLTFEIRRCLGCGLRFLHPQPTAAELNEFYNQEYFGNRDSNRRGYDAYISEAENHRATFRRRLKLMPQPKKGDRLLDVGAAAGYFVEQARELGWEAMGVEPSQWAAEYAASHLSQPVIHATLESAKFVSETFNAITLWEVIEHLSQPRQFLREAARVLKHGGYLILSTPDAGSAVARLFGRRWLGWNKIPEHLYYFDRATLTTLLRQSGFVVQEWKYVSITVQMGFAARRLAELLGMPVLGRMPPSLARLSLPINPLYDLMLVARKTGEALERAGSL